MSVFKDIGWTKKGKSADCLSNVESREARKNNPRGHIGHSSAQEKKKHGMERTLTNPKDSGIKSRQRQWKPHIPSYQCVESRDPEIK